jgi:hypothetical protein
MQPSLLSPSAARAAALEVRNGALVSALEQAALELRDVRAILAALSSASKGGWVDGDTALRSHVLQVRFVVVGRSYP